MIRIDKRSKVTGVTEAVRELNKIDKDIVKQLRTDMKTLLLPEAKELAGDIDLKPPLSGFNHSGRTRWTGARGSVSVTPSRIRKDKDESPIVTIRLLGKGKGAGFEIAEKAGMRNLRYSKNRSAGQQFVKNLNQRAPFNFKGGRFAYGFFLQKRKPIEGKALAVIERFADKVNRRIR